MTEETDALALALARYEQALRTTKQIDDLAPADRHALARSLLIVVELEAIADALGDLADLIPHDADAEPEGGFQD